MVLILALCALLLVGYVVMCLFYFVFQERFIFIRYGLAPRARFRFKYPFEERFLDTPDGARLHALYFPAENSPTGQAARGVVLYFHGNAGNLRRWGKYAPRFTALGYDVLMPDYRGYGKSHGKLSEAALHADAKAWYRSLLDRWPEQDIVIYGRSLGSAMATPVAAEHAPRLLLLETPFANLRDVARYYLRILPYRWLLRYAFRNDQAIKRVRCPVYIFHGRRDTVVPYASALRLYSLVPTTVEREMFTFAKGHHSDLVRFRRFNRTVARILTIPKAAQPLRTADGHG
jgi:fermentation-respiration switch protein FrsA (DUF1100 family)